MNKIKGDYAWLVMGLSILIYDLLAIKTKRAETMSSAIWRSLEHPIKTPLVTLIWLKLTHHLFFNKNARRALKTHINKNTV
jgi:hypothetical protein